MHLFRFHRAILVFILLSSPLVHAHQPTRFVDEVFADVEVSTEIYQPQRQLEMDIYQPAGDTAKRRPAIILAHGGGFVGGNKNNPIMERMARDFAKRGFVVVSINYRLAQNMGQMFDTLQAATVVIKAVADGRAAVSFLHTSAMGENPYRINPNQIAFAGNSAGGIVATHVALLDAQDSVSAMIGDALKTEGLDQDDEFLLAKSHVSAVINMAGAIKNTRYIDAQDVPIICFHGKRDDVVPYDCGPVYSNMGGFFRLIYVCGSLPIFEQAQRVGLNSQLHSYKGKHMPWKINSADENNALLQEIEQKIADFLWAIWSKN